MSQENFLREVQLFGSIGRQFGRCFRLAVKTPAEAVRALSAVLPGFERAFVGPDGRQRYHVFIGRGAARRDIGAEQAEEPIGRSEPIRIVPVIAGAKKGGLFQSIVGAVLLVAGIFTGNATLVQIGASLLLGGIVQMLSPQRQGRDSTTDGKQSYAFDGPINITTQGGPVPVIYGIVIAGSVVASQGLTSNEIVMASQESPASAATPTWYSTNGQPMKANQTDGNDGAVTNTGGDGN